MKRKIVELYIIKDKKVASGWTQLVAVDENGSRWIIKGAYCGGIPESTWVNIDEEEEVKKLEESMICERCKHSVDMHGDNGICYSCKSLGEKCLK